MNESTLDVQFVVSTDYDESPDTSYLGEYTDSDAPGNVKRFDYTSTREYNYFAPCVTEEEHFVSLRAMTRGKLHVYSVKRARALARSYVQQDYERVEGLNNGNWYYVYVTVKLQLNGKIIGRASLSGIESDSGNAYLDEVTRDLCAEAYTEGVNYLKSLASAVTLPSVEDIELID